MQPVTRALVLRPRRRDPRLSAAVILFTSDTKVLSVLIFDLEQSGDVGVRFGSRAVG